MVILSNHWHCWGPQFPSPQSKQIVVEIGEEGDIYPKILSDGIVGR